MARAALEVAHQHLRDDEVSALRTRAWRALCQAGIRLCRGRCMDGCRSIVRDLIAYYLRDEQWGVAEGVIMQKDGRDDGEVGVGLLNFNSNADGEFLHIECMLLDHIARDLRHAFWRPLKSHFELVQDSGLYRPVNPRSMWMFHKGPAPVRSAEEFNVWADSGTESSESGSE